METRTSRRSVTWRTAVSAWVALLLAAGCGNEKAAEEPPAVAGGDEVTTPEALAWVAAQHVGDPSSASIATDFEELGRDAVGTEMRYETTGEYDGDLFAVVVADNIPARWLACDVALEGYLTGCEQTADGLLMWQGEAPGEDPGSVVVLVEKSDAHAVVLYAGPAISGDPRELELPIGVDDMFALAEDPRVDLTTSAEAIDKGESLTFWEG